jgi:hypothetical protein
MGRLPGAPQAMSKTFCVEAKTVGALLIPPYACALYGLRMLSLSCLKIRKQLLIPRDRLVEQKQRLPDFVEFPLCFPPLALPQSPAVPETLSRAV